ncbi:MAG TPA: N,N-dimethylformamidase beta subunit family domain-containing protein [Solirubrobacteraceae bacterium]|nr:N,N-dimethylformamidase beta subunit family domain-containing protein [Solirubrobacteraceae bacterium]
MPNNSPSHAHAAQRTSLRPAATLAALFATISLCLALAGALLALGASPAAAEVSCPNANPIVNENNCMGEGTTANRLSNYSEEIGGFTTQTSYAAGENVQLKIGTSAPSFPSTNVSISVYRIGYYGGNGARLIAAAGSSKVKVNNSLTCNPMNKETGELSCSNWATTYTIPGSSLPVSGIYEAVFTDLADGGIQNYAIFTVRNDASTAEVLYVLPVSTYEAYNTWGCKSLYFDACGLGNTVAGDERAVKVSFERPISEGEAERNKFFGPDARTVEWLEEQGYNVSYTDDIQLAREPETLLHHKIILISGHSEYWSYAAFNNVLAAREHGVNIASLSSNTAYWQTRFENNYRTLVCYKTVQGSSSGSASATPNDPASIGPKGEFIPQNATTTRRDFGAPAGNPNAPPEGRVGVGQPENELFGSMYVGDNEEDSWGLTVPAGNANGEYETSRVWRGAGLPSNAQTTIPGELVGWEWDQIPSAESPLYAHAAELEPEGVKRLTLTNTSDPASTWLQDYGRERAATPPPGQSSEVSAVEYRAKSGAWVFSSGTMQWAYGFDGDAAINQATYNILFEMGATPVTPESGITLKSPTEPKPPWPIFKASAGKVLVGEPVTFNASATTDPDATITNYYWDTEGNGFTENTGTTSSLTHSFAKPGVYEVILKVIDSEGQEETTSRTITVTSPIVAQIAAKQNPAAVGQSVTFSAAESTDVSGPITDYKWDLEGTGKYTTDTGSNPTVSTSFQTTGTHTVGVQVSDAAGNTATATLTETVVNVGVSNYEESVLAAPSLLHFYPLGESSGPTVRDVKGSANGTLTGVNYGVPGAVNGDPATAVNFPGAGDPDEGELGSYGEVPLELSGQSAITIEFWMKWSTYGDDDSLAMEFTPNSNEHAGGFLVDPDSPQYGGTFGIGLGEGSTRNSVYIQRPSAGVWHHYALVLDPTKPASEEIKPYVDGQLVSFQQEGTGTGAGNFANSTLYLMSRDAKTLFGSGSLQDLAIYGGDLSAATIQEHFYDNGTDPRPKAAFSATPSPARPGQTVTFNAGASSYSKGTIKKYEWDLKGTGNYETTTTTPTVTASYSSEQTVHVGLRVTDSNGGWDYTTQELKVGNFPPVAHLAISPSQPLVGEKVTLNASESTDQGTITDYKWDLGGSGKYETDSGSTPTVTTYFQAAGVHQVGLELTDNEGLKSKTTIPVKVLEQGVAGYTPTVERTAGLTDYYKLSEASGPTIFDSVGSSNGTVTGGTFGVPGGVSGDPSTALEFGGANESGAIPLNLSGTGTVTVEFWLKWKQYANNDSLAMEFTPNFNENPGGFLVDPDAPQFGGSFGVGIGSGNTRNSIFFTRPSAGAWHHYALVFNTTKPANEEITPYVDGQPVAFQQEGANTGQGAFANSTLYLMSRGGNSLFGAGALQDLAIYSQPLSAGQVFQHYSSEGTNEAPHAVFTVSPTPVRAGQGVTLNASGSTDSGGRKIVAYQWALSGSGDYETETSSPTLNTSFANPGTYNVSLRVIDSGGASESVTHAVEVGNFPPVAQLTATPNPVQVGKTVTLSAAGSTDQGTITDYKWDLEGKGTYETNTGTTPTVTTSFAGYGNHTVGVEVTDNEGLSTRKTITVTVLPRPRSSYPSTVEATHGLTDFYTLGESAGPEIKDSVGTSNGTINGGTFGLPGAVQEDSGSAIGFNGTSDSGAVPLNLSGTSVLTVEFWLKWNQYANNDSLAMEFTPNFNENAGGFLVDPNASQFGGTFGVAIGNEATRNSVFFARPSAGVWHHYALVINTTKPAGEEITPYVDGQPVSFQQSGANTGQGAFANSTLYLMSRDDSSLFGAGDLQYLAIYNKGLSASTIFQHYYSGGSAQAQNEPEEEETKPVEKHEEEPAPPPDTTPPTGGALKVNGTAASEGGSSSYNTAGSFSIERTDYSEEKTKTQSGLASSTLTVATASLASNSCGSFGTPSTIGGSPAQTEPTGCYRYTLTGTDNAGNSASISTTVMVDTTPPSTPSLAFSGLSQNTYYSSANNTLYFRPASGGAFTVTASASDAASGILGYTFSPLAANGFSESQGGGQNVYAFGESATQPATAPTVSATNNAGAASANTTYNLVADTSAPTGGALSVNGTAASGAGTSSYSTTGTFTGTRTDYGADTGSGLASSVLTVAKGTLSNGGCINYEAPAVVTGAPSASSSKEGCYLYTLTGTDHVGNAANISTTIKVDKTPPAATVSVPADANGPVAVTFAATDSGSGVNATKGQLKRAVATYTPSTNICGTFGAYANIGSAGPTSPYSDSTVSTGHCYEYEYSVPDLAGNGATAATSPVRVSTTKPALSSISDSTPGTTAGLPQVGDAITLNFTDQIAAASIPSSVTLTYSRAGAGATQIAVSGLGSGSWSAGDTFGARYTKPGGTSPVVTASTSVSGSTVKLTVTKISDPSSDLTAGGPDAVSGTLNASLKDVFGNTASTSSFTTSSVRLF